MNTGIVFHRPVFIGKEIDEYRAWKKFKQESVTHNQKSKTLRFVGTAKIHLSSLARASN